MAILKNFKIDVDQVLKVYSGKRGCMCGCNGKYKYSTLNRELASEDRGSKVEFLELGDNAIVRRVNKFNREGEFSVDVNAKTGKVNDYVFIETETRMNCIYLKKGTMENVKI